MVAYSFNKRFVPAIREGLKTHTLRGEGKRRHARVGETVQLYTGMRTRQCQLIGRSSCDRLHGVLLNFESRQAIAFFDVVETEPGRYRATHSRAALRPVDDVDGFARRDGFTDLRDMAAFWDQVHKANRWAGLLIGWTGYVSAGAAALGPRLRGDDRGGASA